jgi:hypothetical protein
VTADNDTSFLPILSSPPFPSHLNLCLLSILYRTCGFKIQAQKRPNRLSFLLDYSAAAYRLGISLRTAAQVHYVTDLECSADDSHGKRTRGAHGFNAVPQPICLECGRHSETSATI